MVSGKGMIAVIMFTLSSSAGFALGQDWISTSSAIADCGRGECSHDKPCTPCSCWYVSADAIWLQRDEGNAMFLAERRSNTGALPNTLTGSLTSHSIDFDYEPGIRLLIGHQIDEFDSVELSYLGLNDWDEHAELLGPPAPQTDPLLTSPVLFAVGNNNPATAITADFSTRIHGAELNVRRRMPSYALTVLAGVRYFRAEDDVRLQAINTNNPGGSPAVFERASLNASNDLVGLQVGCQRRFAHSRLAVDFEGKAGLFANFNEQRMNDFILAGPIPAGLSGNRNPLWVDEDDTSLSGIIDVGITGTFAVSPRLSLRGGYQVLVVDGLALAPEQVALLGSATANQAAVTNATLPSASNDAGVMILNGFFLGLDARW